MDIEIRHEKSFEIMKAVLPLPEDVQSQIDLDIRICNHIINVDLMTIAWKRHAPG